MTQIIEPTIQTTLPLEGQTFTPDDVNLARERIVAADELIVLAIEAARSGDPQRASELVGRSSDAVAGALYHLREAKRRAV